MRWDYHLSDMVRALQYEINEINGTQRIVGT